ncbi:phage holin family protein [Variovorax dokdonensis]|uniref:Phage holin family protein n=1 Tax=Variovorax dokdonensis TaxID=344883 RepID=A0ABT7NB86_9BURK|nr:phage holin family protein [Variovorax dokdonensis]MDM0045125.1 phage holin family protein [Variovorax dokdonensis]
MFQNLTSFLAQWAVTGVSLWIASLVFTKSIRFDSTGALIGSALLLGLANALVKPLLIVLTLPLTVLTFGLFLLVVNALVLLLVSALVKGFRVSGFWMAVFASLFISIVSIIIGGFVFGGSPEMQIHMPTDGGTWL